MNPFGGSAGDWVESTKWVADTIRNNAMIDLSAEVSRGSASELSYMSEFIDAVITDPP